MALNTTYDTKHTSGLSLLTCDANNKNFPALHLALKIRAGTGTILWQSSQVSQKLGYNFVLVSPPFQG